MADVHNSFYPPTDEEIEMMEDRISAYIFPNVPRTEEEKTAFNKAVLYQIAHEKTLADVLGEELSHLPDGTTSFSIGTFSMSFGNGGYKNSAVLTKESICPYAYSVLLRAGLLYKGVGVVGGCCECL